MLPNHVLPLFGVLSILFVAPGTWQTITPTLDEPVQNDVPSITMTDYDSTFNRWIDEGAILDHRLTYTQTPNDFSDHPSWVAIENTQTYIDYLATEERPFYDGPLAMLSAASGSQVSFNINVSQSILVELRVDYFSLSDDIRPLELSVQVNDAFPYLEAQQILLNKRWTTPTTFQEDRFGNQIMPRAEHDDAWATTPFRDSTYLQEYPLLFLLNPGDNTITLFAIQGDWVLGQIYVYYRQEVPTYQDYLDEIGSTTRHEQNRVSVEAELPTERNSLLLRYGTNREPSVLPFALIESKLNVVDGATFQTSGQSISYSFNVPAAGFYRLTVKALQNRVNTISYRRLYVNGQLPFKEAKAIPFEYNGSWQNVLLSSRSGEPLWFYFSSGVNTLTLEATSHLTKEAYRNVQSLMNLVNRLNLNIKKLTGNTIDPNREWNIRAFLPTIDEDLAEAIDQLVFIETSWKDVMKASTNSEVLSSITLAKRVLEDLARNPDLIPRKINTLSGASGSVLYRLGLILPLIIQSPLTMDRLDLHGNQVKLPNANADFFTSVWVGIQRFFASFFAEQYQASSDPDEVTVWVTRSRQYVNLLQQMVDAEFTPSTGIKVRLSINPNEDKLILASSSGKQPDIAMGIAGWRPYDFAIRNNVTNLRTFDDFPTVADRFYPGSFLQLIYEDGVYGLPETQNFYFLFYRKDIMSTLNLDVPNTWNDVIGLLPELQRFGLNFYSMLSSSNAFKAFVHTMPFIQQFGGKIYEDDALRAAFDDPKTIEAFTLMTDLYSTYSLPLEVGSFYNEFRYGRLPLGIGDFGMYITLLHAAPEIAGLWDIAPLPGVLRDGVVNRSFDGASTSAMMFKNSDKPNEAWSFLKWWTSKQTQLDYAENLISAYGPEYMWNTSNIEAFSDLSWNPIHQQVMLDQWQWVNDTVKTPSSYMLEREISNIWNKVVYQGINLRTAIEDSLIITNKEITRKMIEFGYLDRQGTVLKPYRLPTLETVDEWLGTSL